MIDPVPNYALRCDRAYFAGVFLLVASAVLFVFATIAASGAYGGGSAYFVASGATFTSCVSLLIAGILLHRQSEN